MADRKPLFPKEGIKLAGCQHTEFELLHDWERYSNGHMLMTLQCGTITDSHTGEKLAEVGVTPALEVAVWVGQRLWVIDPKELVQQALAIDAEYLKQQRAKGEGA